MECTMPLSTTLPLWFIMSPLLLSMSHPLLITAAMVWPSRHTLLNLSTMLLLSQSITLLLTLLPLLPTPLPPMPLPTPKSLLLSTLPFTDSMQLWANKS